MARSNISRFIAAPSAFCASRKTSFGQDNFVTATRMSVHRNFTKVMTADAHS
jgi:hypothetical protein